ncbi:9946_t:CDS:2, partial [Paraglomus occultum]
MTIFLVLLLGHTTILIVDVVNDTPIIRTKLISVNSIPLPTVTIMSGYNFTTSCVLLYNSLDGCNQHIKQQPPIAVPGTGIKKNAVAFVPPLNLHVQTLDNLSGLLGVALVNNIIDPTFNANTTSDSDLAFGMDIVVNNTEPDLSISLYQQSTYSLAYQQYRTLNFNRNERLVIKPNALATIGIPSGRIRVPYITTSLDSNGPLSYHPDTFKPNCYGILSIRASSFVVRTDIEFRPHTVLGLIGLVGGAWGLSASLYAVLFGNDPLRPWGWVQFYCCCFVPRTRSQLYQSFSVIPFQQRQRQQKLITSLSNQSFESGNFASHELSENLKNQSDSLEQSTKERLDALELFMQEYIIDTTYLDGLNENNYPNKL